MPEGKPDTKQRKRLSPVELDSHALAHGAITDMDSSAWVGELSHTRRQGTAVVFPSFLCHRVHPVHAGTRAALVAWAHGPAFA